jgi:myosin-light-chain kinase
MTIDLFFKTSQPENILCLTESGNRIKIIDFGLAREYDPSNKLQVLFGTPEFVACEVVNFDAITFATDMWAVGVIAYVL